jgi:hypothetical protein
MGYRSWWDFWWDCALLGHAPSTNVPDMTKPKLDDRTRAYSAAAAKK